MNDKIWADFLDWLYKTHSLTRDYTPNRTSIDLWRAYETEQAKKKGKANKEGSKGKKKQV